MSGGVRGRRQKPSPTRSVCCPEAYLTAEEIEDLQKQMEESKEGRYIQVNLHSWLSVMGSVNESQENVEYSVAIAASHDGILY